MRDREGGGKRGREEKGGEGRKRNFRMKSQAGSEPLCLSEHAHQQGLPPLPKRASSYISGTFHFPNWHPPPQPIQPPAQPPSSGVAQVCICGVNVCSSTELNLNILHVGKKRTLLTGEKKSMLLTHNVCERIVGIWGPRGPPDHWVALEKRVLGEPYWPRPDCIPSFYELITPSSRGEIRMVQQAEKTPKPTSARCGMERGEGRESCGMLTLACVCCAFIPVHNPAWVL